MKKLPHELTNEELLSQIDTTQPIQEYRNDVLDFISTYKLKQGPEKIRRNILYDLYKCWSKNPINKQTFALEIGRLFETDEKYLNLNIPSANLLRKLYDFKKPQIKIVSKKWKQHFENYLNYYQITSGTFFVKTEVLYNLYDKWTYNNNNKNPLGIDQFRSFCNLYFKKKVARHYHWFGVNRSIFAHLNEELINELLRKKVNKHVKKEKNKKIPV